MNNTRLLGLIAILLVPLIAGCGVHVSSDPTRVDHVVSFDFSGMLDHCEAVCQGSAVCFEDCARRFIDLLSDPQICASFNTCAQ